METTIGSGPRPNILLITADQLRFDSLGVAGHPQVRTPNIDRLATEGAFLEHHFTQSPVCQPSRATLATGRYPKAHGVKYNFYDFPDQPTIQSILGDAGYDTIAIGKMHFEPVNELHGFHRKVFVEGKMYIEADDYRTWLDEKGLGSAYRDYVRTWRTQWPSGAAEAPVDLESYIDTYIGNRATEELTELASPFFAWVSFVNPHPPYDPPQPYSDMYNPADIALPPDVSKRQSNRFPEHRAGSAGRDFSDITLDDIREARAQYLGAITLLDHYVGKVIDSLRERKLLDDTLVLFTSDHGDLLGNRGMLYKGGRMLYDHILRVPFIARYPREISEGKVYSHLTQATDVLPTILDFAGVEPPASIQGRTLRALLRGDQTSALRSSVFAEGLDVKMIRDLSYKLIYYPGRPYGELYYIAEDVLEEDNLYAKPEYRTIRSEYTELLAARLIDSEDPLPLPNRRAGYYDVTRGRGLAELK